MMLLKLFGLALPALPRIDIPDWLWIVGAVALVILGYTALVERAAQARARAASQARENQRMRRALEERLRIEADYEDDWTSRPADGDALDGLLRSGAF